MIIGEISEEYANLKYGEYRSVSTEASKLWFSEE